MNRSTPGLKLGKAIEGFLQAKAAEGCSLSTMTSYTQHLKLWLEYAGDVDVGVKHGARGGAKGGKGRTVYLGKVARRQLWRYLAKREDGDDPKAPVFVGKFDRPFNKGVLRQLIARLGQKANVTKCHPHRFRHTFSITYLRSGGDVFTLQRLLGHSSLEMVQHYAKIAQVDIEQAHRRASPADNWRL